MDEAAVTTSMSTCLNDLAASGTGTLENSINCVVNSLPATATDLATSVMNATFTTGCVSQTLPSGTTVFTADLLEPFLLCLCNGG